MLQHTVLARHSGLGRLEKVIGTVYDNSCDSAAGRIDFSNILIRVNLRVFLTEQGENRNGRFFEVLPGVCLNKRFEPPCFCPVELAAYLALNKLIHITESVALGFRQFINLFLQSICNRFFQFFPPLTGTRGLVYTLLKFHILFYNVIGNILRF